MSTTETISLQRNLPKRKMVSKSAATDYAFIKKLIWAYFILLLFEGALRKWFLPGLSQGLLIIRDPIVIWIYYLAYVQGVFPINNKYLKIVERYSTHFNMLIKTAEHKDYCEIQTSQLMILPPIFWGIDLSFISYKIKFNCTRSPTNKNIK